MIEALTMLAEASARQRSISVEVAWETMVATILFNAPHHMSEEAYAEMLEHVHSHAAHRLSLMEATVH